MNKSVERGSIFDKERPVELKGFTSITSIVFAREEGLVSGQWPRVVFGKMASILRALILYKKVVRSRKERGKWDNHGNREKKTPRGGFRGCAPHGGEIQQQQLLRE